MYSSVQCVVLSYVRFSTVVYIKHHHPELSLDSFALLCRVSLLLTYYALACAARSGCFIISCYILCTALLLNAIPLWCAAVVLN